MTAPIAPPKPIQNAVQTRNQQYLGQQDTADTQAYWDQQDEIRKQKLAKVTVPAATPMADQLTNGNNNAQNMLSTIGQTGQIALQGVQGSQQTQQIAKQARQLKKWQDDQATAYQNLQAQYAAQIAAMQYTGNATGTNTGGQGSGLQVTGGGGGQYTVAAGQYTYEDPKDQQIAAWARQAGWAESDIPMVIAVAQAESSRRNDATNDNPNGSTDYGLMQINTIHAGDGGAIGADFFNGGWRDPVQNLKAALQIKNARGSWKDWVTFQNGDYEGYHPKYSVATQTQTFGTAQVSGVGGQVNNTVSGLRVNLVGTGMKYLGTPYVFAGDSLENGVDCSGLVHEIFSRFNIATPRTADTLSHPDEYAEEGAYGGNQQIKGFRTDIANLKPGDLICYQGGWRGDALVGHVALYAGNGEIIEAPDVGLTVRRRKLRANEIDISKGGKVIGIHLQLPGD